MDSWWPGEGKAVEANSVLSVFAFLNLDMLYCTKLSVNLLRQGVHALL